MEVIIESATLYSISALVLTPMFANPSYTAPNQTYYLYAELFFIYTAVKPRSSYLPILISNSALQNFAPALIMLRVVLGRARPDTEWSGKISDLQFGSTSGGQESTRSRGVVNTILTFPKSHHGEVDLEANGEPPLADVEERRNV
jgi:hypothetical protein